MKTNFKMIVTVLLVSFMFAGCAGHVGVQEREYTSVSEFKTTGKAVARAANDVGPDINDIDTCPGSLPRYNHKAGGSADSSIKVTEKGTRFSHDVEFGQSHKCGSSSK